MAHIVRAIWISLTVGGSTTRSSRDYQLFRQKVRQEVVEALHDTTFEKQDSDVEAVHDDPENHQKQDEKHGQKFALATRVFALERVDHICKHTNSATMRKTEL